jgi:hypothetical protein
MLVPYVTHAATITKEKTILRFEILLMNERMFFIFLPNSHGPAFLRIVLFEKGMIIQTLDLTGDFTPKVGAVKPFQPN